jgi:rhodanese-related sulfurtransferase
MSAYTTISPDKLSRLLGSPKGPTLIDIRQEAEFAADPRLIPGAVRRDAGAIALWGRTLAGTATVVIGQRAANLSHGVEAAVLLAASLGLSRLHADDLEQLEAGLALYDAFYRWCRDAVDESHAAHAAAPGKRK